MLSPINIDRGLVLAAATHRWVSPQDLSKLYVDYEQAYRLLRQHFDEVFILQTCHRVEYYLYSEDALSEDYVTNMLARLYEGKQDVLKNFKIFRGRDVIEHILRVAAGLDSAIIGETDVLGQVESAYQRALRAGTLRGVLRCLVEYAIRFGKHVRTTTGIARGITGFGSLAVKLLKKLYVDLSTVKILVVGAGEMGSSIVKELNDEGAKSVIILNRTLDKARELASKYGYMYDSLTQENLLRYLEQIDVAIFAVSTSEPLLRREHIKQLRKRPLIVDLGVPPNVDAQGETAVITFEDLCKLAEKYNREKLEEAKKVESMLKDEINRVIELLNARFLSRMIGTYMRFIEKVKTLELKKALNRKVISEDSIKSVELVVSSVINKALRPLIKTIQDLARESPSDAYMFLRRILDSVSREFSEVMRKVASDHVDEEGP